MHLNLHLHLHSALSGRSPVVSIRPTSLSSSSSVSSGRSSTVISAAYRFHLFQPSFVVIWPSFSGSVQPVWPFRLLSGYSGRFGRISAISAAVRPLRFRALLRPLRLYFGHLLCRRLSRFGHRRLSGCLLPPVVPLRLSGPCLLFGHSPAADCSWPSVGLAIGFLAAAVWLPPLQPLFSHSDRWMLGHSGYSATVRPPPLLGCHRNRFPRFSMALSSLTVSLLVGFPIPAVVRRLFGSMFVARSVPLCLSGPYGHLSDCCSSTCPAIGLAVSIVVVRRGPFLWPAPVHPAVCIFSVTSATIRPLLFWPSVVRPSSRLCCRLFGRCFGGS